MDQENNTLYTAFSGSKRIATGALVEVATTAKQLLDTRPQATVLIFADHSGQVVDIDYRGSIEEMLARLRKRFQSNLSPEPAEQAASAAPRKRGRPKLGVVAREVTLLPRHWEWLNDQPGGASVALRKLVETARRQHSAQDRVRHAQNAAFTFMAAMAGDLPGFEEASRALFAGDRMQFETCLTGWPLDIGKHTRKLAAEALKN